MEKYCYECGTKLVRAEIQGFDESTGKRSTKMTCPNVYCDRNFLCPVHEDKRHHYSFWKGHCKCGNKNPGYGLM